MLCNWSNLLTGIHSDIYTGWVAQVLDADLLVETWQTLGHELPSNCSLPKHAMNIKRIKLPGSVLFQSHHDHSKWCVSWAYKDQVTCLGDLNRERAQLWRGGGLVCSFNPLIYKAFRQVVDWYIDCWTREKERMFGTGLVSRCMIWIRFKFMWLTLELINKLMQTRFCVPVNIEMLT